MKKWMTLVPALLVAVFGFSQTNEHVCKEISELEIHELSRHALRINFRGNPLTSNYDVHYHDLRWKVDPSIHFIEGTVTTHFIALEEGMTRLHFDLSDSLVVNSVIHRGNQVAFRRSDQDILQIDLSTPLQAGENDKVVIDYKGAPPKNGFGSFETSLHEDVPIMWTLSEPYGARDWWPCKQDLLDKIDSIDVRVAAPVGNRVASNGLLVSETVDQSEVTFHWKHRYPIPAYLIAIAVTNYAVYEDKADLGNGDSLDILHYVFPEDFDRSQRNTPIIPQMIELYNELFGRYPFSEEKYGHAQFGWGGGMEHQTMSFMGGFSFELQAHELAHQWFGNKVTCGSWQDIWVNEGFATYLTGVAIEHLSTTYWQGWKESNMRRVTSQPDGSVFVTDTTNVGRIFSGRLSYSKGAFVLHMLRWLLGDDKFFDACENYLNDPELAFGFATTEDVKRHMENQFGDDLEYFFQDWIYGQGYPTYTITWSQKDEDVRLLVSQSTSHPSVEFFEQPLPITIYGEGQQKEFVFWNDVNDQIFTATFPYTIDSVKFDEVVWLVSGNNIVKQGVVSVDDQLEAALSSIRPNPVGDQLMIDLEGGTAVVRLFDAQGRMLMERSVTGRSQIDVSEWQPGIYLLRLSTEDRSLTTQIVKN